MMSYTYLTIVMPTPPNVDIPEYTWAEVVQLLLPNLGKSYGRFEPACQPGGVPSKPPYCVFTGRSHPEEFLFLYQRAKTIQRKAMAFHTEEMTASMDFEKTMDTDDITVYRVHGGDEATQGHILWHISLLAGELLPDAGMYFPHKHMALLEPEQHQEILSDLQRYALCVVKIFAKEEDSHEH